MEPQDCPLPEVESALGPFIKSRDEVAAVRRNLQAYLQKQLPGDDKTPLSAVNLTTSLDETLAEPPAALAGVRKAYWKALQANQTAQAKYDALKADLDALKRPSPILDAASPAISISETYIPLLRQKEKLRRLKVLEDAYSSLPTPASASESLEERLGPQPTPPSTHPPTSSSSQAGSDQPDVESKLLELKKAVLKTRRRVQDQEARNAVAKASLPPAAEVASGAKIAGLQKALQELTGWMEEMLGVIADAEAEAAQETSVPLTPSAANGTPGQAGTRRVDLDEIETAYERYILSRRRLIRTLSSPPPADSEMDAEPLFPTTSSNTNATRPNTTSKPSPAELLLPYVPALTSLKTHESTLLNQKAYLRAQVSSSEAEIARLIQRLAGESHLVGPGASRGEDWAVAGREAGVETERVVLGRVKVGEVSAAAATEALRGIEGVRG